MLLILLGFLTGALVGMTGTGGGVLLTPLLLLLTPYPAVVVIGTGIVSGAVTKLVGVVEHRRLGQVHLRLAAALGMGSLLGASAGAVFVRFLKTHLAPAPFDHALKIILAFTLLGVSLFLPFVRRGGVPRASAFSGFAPIAEQPWLVAIGAVVGFMVVVTSIGSGSLLMLAMLLLLPLPLGELVGTDLLVGLVTLAFGGAVHLAMGHFSTALFVPLAAGSLPGVVVGSRLSRRIPERYFNWLFTVVYFSLGARLLAG